MKQAQWRMRYKGEVMPRAEDLASAIGNPGVHVVSSPATIGYLEMACLSAVGDLLEADEATVGVGFRVRHVGAAHPGKPVEVSAELFDAEERMLRFKVEANQDGRPVMTGIHERAVVTLSRFLKAKADRPKPQLTFWFDFHSPWCWLAAERIGTLAQKQGAELAWRPLHLPNLIEEIDGRQPLEENPAFVKWYRQDLLDHAAGMGLEIHYHPQYPLRNSRALRAALYAIDEGKGEAFVRRVMRAYWSKQADITDLGLLARLGEACGLDGAKVAEAAQSSGLKAKLEANTAEAIKRGVFGVPTIDTGEKLFFGFDHLDMLDRHLSELAAR